jgi:hypothetical protein
LIDTIDNAVTEVATDIRNTVDHAIEFAGAAVAAANYFK